MLPLILLVVVGGLHLGLMVLDRTRVSHAAAETAVNAASDPQGCANADAVARRIYGAALDSVACSSTGQEVQVIITHSFGALLPWLPDHVTATERAVLRD